MPIVAMKVSFPGTGTSYQRYWLSASAAPATATDARKPTGADVVLATTRLETVVLVPGTV